VPTAGFGLVQAFFAAERHASIIADSLGIDPAEWRKNFFLRKGRKLPIGIDLKNPPLEELIDSVEAMGDYRRKWAAYELLRKNRREAASAENLSYEALRGIGLSLAYQGNSLLYDHRAPKAPEEGVELTLEKDGTLEIRTALPWGDNQLSVWREIASKTLGVETVRIVTKAEAPKTVPESGPACLSRSINIITELVEKACIAIRKQRFRDPLPITVHRYYRSSRVQPWADNQQARPKGTGYVGPEGYGLYAGLEEKIDENALGCLSWGAAVVEVVVDTATYLPFVRGIWLSIDGGTIQSEERAKKSICASATQALSWAMQEDVQYENGRIDPRRVRDYPVLPDYSPPITVDFLWSEGKSRGIGELPFALIPAAFAQALSQAMDCHFCHYPITSPDIWKAAQQFSAGAGP
jgi:CO/xanthine dehydrogenase Mo-binding subunit